MDKEKAINVIKEYYPFSDKELNEAVETFIPDIKESEDEKIRKAIIRHFQVGTDYISFSGFSKDKIFAWLKKKEEKKPVNMVANLKEYLTNTPKEQIEKDWDELKHWNNICPTVEEFLYRKQNPTDKLEPKFEIGDLITNGILVGKIDEIHKLGYHAFFGDHFADVPDIENWHKWTIQDVKDGDVLSYRDGQWIFIYKEKNDDNSFYYHTLYSTIHQDLTIDDAAFTLLGDAIIPATKEQRDLLFKKVKEAGYEWDAKKKELKKIEQKSKAKYIYPKFRIGDVISQKHPDLDTITYTIVGFNEEMPDYLVDGGNVPSCSIGIDFIDKNFTLVNKKSSGCHDGDDEKLINNVIELIDAGSLDRDEKDFYIEKLESLKERVQSNGEWTEEDEQMVRFYEAYTNNQVGNWPQNKVLEMKSKFNDWVKKVKYRVQPQWKPSKEQLTALEHVSSEYIGSWQPEMLTLFDDLKTLYDNYNKSEK